MRVLVCWLVLCSLASAQQTLKFVTTETFKTNSKPAVFTPFEPVEEIAPPSPIAPELIHGAFFEAIGIKPTPPAASGEREVVLHMMPGGYCGPCETTHLNLQGLPGLRISRSGGFASYPTLTISDRPGDRWQGVLTRRQVDLILSQYPPSTPPGALTIGSMPGKEQVGKLLDSLKAVGPGKVTVSWELTNSPSVGTDQAGLKLPARGTATYQWQADSMSLRLSPDVPLATTVIGFKVHQPVRGVVVTRDKLTVEMPGVIDLAKQLR